jgi:hypothetical protein
MAFGAVIIMLPHRRRQRKKITSHVNIKLAEAG